MNSLFRKPLILWQPGIKHMKTKQIVSVAFFALILIPLAFSCARAEDAAKLHEQVKQELLIGQDEKAFQLCEKILRINPKDEEAKLTQAFLYLKKRELDQSEKFFLDRVKRFVQQVSLIQKQTIPISS